MAVSNRPRRICLPFWAALGLPGETKPVWFPRWRGQLEQSHCQCAGALLLVLPDHPLWLTSAKSRLCLLSIYCQAPRSVFCKYNAIYSLLNPVIAIFQMRKLRGEVACPRSHSDPNSNPSLSDSGVQLYITPLCCPFLPH